MNLYLSVNNKLIPFAPSLAKEPTLIEGDADTCCLVFETEFPVSQIIPTDENGVKTGGGVPIRPDANGFYQSEPLKPGRHGFWLNGPYSNFGFNVRFEYRLTPAPVIPTVPAIQVEIEQLKSYHLRANVTSAQVCHWDVDGTIRGGFNAAAACMGMSQRITCLTTGQVVEIKLKHTDNRTVVPVGADLADYLKDGVRLTLNEGEYTLSREVTVKDVIVIGNRSGKCVVKWTGQDCWPGTKTPKQVISASDSAFWFITFDANRPYNPANFQQEKFERPMLFGKGDDCTFIGIKALGWNRVFHPQGSKRWLIQKCFANDQTRTYFTWFEGSDLVFYDNECDNTIFEHICRGGPSNAGDVHGYHYVAFDGNTWQNKDNRPTDPNDDAKGTIVAQAGEFLYRRKNKCIGPTGVGPLAVNDNGFANQLTEHVVIEDEDVIGKTLQVWPGAHDVLILRTPYIVETPRNLSGPKLDPRKVSGLKLVGVAAPTPQPWIEDAQVIEYTAE